LDASAVNRAVICLALKKSSSLVMAAVTCFALPIMSNPVIGSMATTSG
jgi:hypothetical protein